MEATATLTQTIRRLIRGGALRCGTGYSRAALIHVFASEVGEEAAPALFQALRAALRRGGLAGGPPVRTTGIRRGTKYIFDEGDSARDDAQCVPKGRRGGSSPGPGATDPARGRVSILAGDNLGHLKSMASGRFRLIYVDPPFNTGKRQARTQISTVRDDEQGDRTGFKGQRYRTIVHGTRAFSDAFDDFLGFLAPRLEEAHRLLAADGSLFVHLDYREVHYAKILLDEIFGRACFMNEIIWAYDYGARAKKRWSAKHDSILWYVKDPARHVFNYEAMDRIPYMAPGLVGPEKAARGKTPTDVWWHTIVSPNGREKTGYPTQKPLGIVRRIVAVHSRPGDELLDFFAGSGTFGEAGAQLGRSVTLIDESEEAVAVMRRRLAGYLEAPAAAGPGGASDAPRDLEG